MASTPAGTQELIRFGDDFAVDLRAFELRHRDRAVKLERLPLQVLLILIEQNGQLVTRDEIARKVWGDDVFVDTDNSINGAIRKIRQALKDDPQEPRYVETLSGRGYRFIAPIFEGDTAKTEPGSEVPLSNGQPPGERAAGRPGPLLAEAAVAPGGRFGLWAAVICSCAVALTAWFGWQYFHAKGGKQSIHSIAVLPLQNLSGDPKQDFFADGMTEELITELSRIPSLRIISHTSVMEYKGTRKHLPEIARELSVDGILEGSVIRENDQVRVTVQLLNGPEDRHIWSESYERPLHGILNLQREVAEAVGRQIRVKLTPEQEASFNARRTVEPEAYDAYVRGRYNLSTQFTLAQPLLQAKNYFEEAIRKDPGFASAYSGLADSYLYLALFRRVPQQPALQSAHQALLKAQQLDDSIGEVHDTLGTIAWRYDWNFAEAEREFNRGIATAPSYSCAHEDRAEFLAFLGRRSEAMAEMARVNELDLGPSAAMTEAGVYYQLRDYAGLVESARKGIASNPNEWVEHINLAFGYEGTGKLPDAVAEYQKAVELSNGDDDANASLAHAYALTGKKAEAQKILQGLESRSRSNDVPPYLLATVYAGLGDKDKALELLTKAFDQRSLELSWHIKADPRIDSLRSDRRFQDLANRFGVPQ